MNKPKRVGKVKNYYGGMWIREKEGRYEWGMEDYNGIEWEEIPEELYKALLNFHHQKPVPQTTNLHTFK